MYRSTYSRRRQRSTVRKDLLTKMGMEGCSWKGIILSIVLCVGSVGLGLALIILGMIW